MIKPQKHISMDIFSLVGRLFNAWPSWICTGQNIIVDIIMLSQTGTTLHRPSL